MNSSEKFADDEIGSEADLLNTDINLDEPHTADIPSELPVLPLPQTVVFPLTLQPLIVQRPAAVAAIALVRRKPKQPFFLHVNFTTPHDPLLIPPSWQGKYDPARIPLPMHRKSPSCCICSPKATLRYTLRCGNRAKS